MFFANDKGHYIEIEVGPHGHWLVLLHNGYRKCFNKGTDLELGVQNEFKGPDWECSLEIPLAYLPGSWVYFYFCVIIKSTKYWYCKIADITRFNAYALHGNGADRHFEALYAVTDGTVKEPDFHNTQYFGRIDSRKIIPDGYNRKPFNDMRYGDLWEEVTKEII